MFILYSLALGLVVLLSSPWWLLQMLRQGKYRAGLAERLGRVPARLKPRAGCVWIHAVSVGEVLAVSHLVRELESSFPGTTVLISTTTLTGQRLARERFGEHRVFYLPLDFGFAIRAYLRRLQPRLLVLAETELWPNLLHLAKKGGVTVAIVNARISDRSFPRYRRFRWLFADVLREVDLFLAQTEEDRERLVEIGAATERTQVSGNLKFDVRPTAGSALTKDLRHLLRQGSRVLVCGSTVEGEEALLLAAFPEVLRKYPSAAMILAPRHPERFGEVADLVAETGLTLVRRSTWRPDHPISSSVFLLDTVGELASVYALADVAFVGGSLFPAGGHNILEPAQHGVAVITGPHTFNFRGIVRIFLEGGGLEVVTAATLTGELLALLEDNVARRGLGARAIALFREHTGATERTLKALRPFLAVSAKEAQ
jgi:3-deoxy-D-manno-octulosonic-acid transferase